MIWEIILWWYVLPMVISIIGVKLVAKLDSGQRHYEDEDEEKFNLRMTAGFLFGPFVNIITAVLVPAIVFYLLTDKVFHYDKIGDEVKERFYKFIKWLTK